MCKSVPQESSSCSLGIPLPNYMFDKTKYLVTFPHTQLGVTVPWLALDARQGGFPPLPLSAGTCCKAGSFVCGVVVQQCSRSRTLPC